MIDLFEELATLVAELDSAGVEYALCGGLAMAIWDLPRATVDIDLLIRRESVPAIEAIGERHGYIFKAGPMRFSEGAIEIHRISKADRETGDMLMLDLLLVTPQVEDVWETRERVAWEGGSLVVVSRDGLIKLKSYRSSGRDLDDIRRLRGEQ
ncbi:MAG TPA: hypothetical protein VGF69_25065 [Thermoanaerobaculia bacterium]